MGKKTGKLALYFPDESQLSLRVDYDPSRHRSWCNLLRYEMHRPETCSEIAAYFASVGGGVDAHSQKKQSAKNRDVSPFRRSGDCLLLRRKKQKCCIYTARIQIQPVNVSVSGVCGCMCVRERVCVWERGYFGKFWFPRFSHWIVCRGKEIHQVVCVHKYVDGRNCLFSEMHMLSLYSDRQLVILREFSEIKVTVTYCLFFLFNLIL